MKKLKLSGKEVRRIGFSGSESIRTAVRTVTSNFRRHQKSEVLEMLGNVLQNPSSYLKDPVWKEVAVALTSKSEKPAVKPVMREKALDFKVFGRDGIDEESIDQMQTAMKLPISVEGALMPDAHVGYGLPIGGVLATYNAVIPYGVGMDIGCRMCMSVYPVGAETIDKNRERLKNILLSETRFGHGAFNDVGDHELFERKEFKEIKFIGSMRKKFIEQLGSSGHGNHFVDIGEFVIKEENRFFNLVPGKYMAVLSHSGSRNFGAEVCKHYTSVARDRLGLTGETGRLAWLDLDSEAGIEYWKAMQLAGDYSKANHHFIHDRIAAALAEKPLVQIENHHNFAWKEKLPDGRELVIHRKGATPAGLGDLGIIPGTMATPAYIVAGKGNDASLQSAAHGAGRLLSRTKAKSAFTREDVNYYLQKQGVELIGGGLDEAPMAYKDIHEVMKSQTELVDTLALFYPKIVRMG